MAVKINGSTGITFEDNDKENWGTGDDLQIYHDGTNSWLSNINGDIEISNIHNNSDDIWIRTTDDCGIQVNKTESAIICNANGSVDLYYNNVKKFETTSTGINVIGSDGVTITGLQDGTADLFFHADGGDDNADKWYAGAYADGTFHILNYASGSWEETIKAAGNGSVELYHDGTKRFETSAAGGSMHGNLYFDDNGRVDFGASSDLQIYHDGSNSYIHEGGTGGLFIRSTVLGLRDTGNSNNAWLDCNSGGSVDLYHNGTKKFETASNGVLIGGHCRPWTSRDDTDDLGGASQRWDDIHATNSTIQTSDRNEKESITATDLGLTFVNKLTPVSFKRKGKTRTHYGLVAQDVETVITDLGKTTTQFAGFIKSDISEEQDGSSYRYGLRMGEFTAPLIKAIQELSTEVETLKTKVAALEAS